MSIKLAYALTTDGAIVHISEIQRGTACSCVCPACGGHLTAKKGAETEHHFAHNEGDDCTGAFTASICCAVKRMIDRRHSLFMPAYMKNRAIEDDGSGIHVIVPEAMIPIERVDLIRKAGEITGLMAYCSGRPLQLRLLTSYSTASTRNMAKIKQVGLPIIEMDFSRDDIIDDALILKCLTQPTAQVYWVYNALAEQKWEALTKLCMKLPIKGEDRSIYTYGCQFIEKRADGFRCYVRSSCAFCEYFFGIYGFGEDRYLLCGKQNAVTEVADLDLTVQQRKKKYGLKY